MSLSIAALVGAGLLSVGLLGGVAAAATGKERERERWASGVWRDVTLRNGVTERSPFHSLESSFNAPGMVEVFPRSQRPSVPAGEPVGEQVHNGRPPLPSAKQTGEENQGSNGVAPVDALPELPIELSEPPHEVERDYAASSIRKGTAKPA